MKVNTISIPPSVWTRLPITEKSLNKATSVALPILGAAAFLASLYVACTFSVVRIALPIGGVILGTALIASQILRFQFRKELAPDEFIALLKQGANFGNQPIVVTGNVDLKKKSQELSLPANLHVTGNLDLSCNVWLTFLPLGLSVGGDLSLSLCMKLTSLPANLSVGRILDLVGCQALTSLGEGLSVGSDLNLPGCKALTSLPEGLSVGGNLSLFGCKGMTSLPTRLSVGGILHLNQCRALTALPDSITTLGPKSDGTTRDVYLEETGLSDALLDRLRGTQAPGMRFHFSHHTKPVAQKWDTLENAYQAWTHLLPEGEQPTLSLGLEGQDLENMLDFLSRLQETADYKNGAARPVLARRIVDVLKTMENDDEYRQRANDTIHHGLATCHDRIIVTFDTLDLMNIVHKAEKSGSREELVKLGKSLLMLEKVQEKARLHATTLTWVDEIEISLAFQIGLRDRLQLPLSTGHMIFRGYAQLSDAQLQAAGDAIEREVAQADVDNFLANWNPWQRMLRREAFPPKEAIQEGDPSHVEDWTCPITNDPISEGVLLNGRVYVYEALKESYVQNPIDPTTRGPIDLITLTYVTKNIRHGS